MSGIYNKWCKWLEMKFTNDQSVGMEIHFRMAHLRTHSLLSALSLFRSLLRRYGFRESVYFWLGVICSRNKMKRNQESKARLKFKIFSDKWMLYAFPALRPANVLMRVGDSYLLLWHINNVSWLCLCMYSVIKWLYIRSFPSSTADLNSLLRRIRLFFLLFFNKNAVNVILFTWNVVISRMHCTHSYRVSNVKSIHDQASAFTRAL